ncbi:MAG TPA: hypothetical protein VID04_01580 [Methylomirabilota bacterium]
MTAIHRRRPATGPPARLGRAGLLFALIVSLAACASPAGHVLTPDAGASVAAPGFDFERDAFAFPNLIRARYPAGTKDLYANYCFVLARGLRQFAQFARFDPAGPHLSHDEYVELVRQVAARAPWKLALPAGERVVIPGYAGLREFSRAEESAVKAGLNGRWWTWVHWTNWRVGFPASPEGQEQVAQEIVDELGAGRLVQLLITNWPKIELNHTVVVYAYRVNGQALELTVWDPNNPDAPGLITFDAAERRFWATSVYDTEFGDIRAFRMYYSWLL